MKEKKTMQKPELEFVRFDESDVIATSGPMNALGKNDVKDYGAVNPINFGGEIGEGLPQ